MYSENFDELKAKAICSECVGEQYLRILVRIHGEKQECSYCSKVGTAICLDELAEEVEAAFDSHFSRTASEPEAWQHALIKDKEFDYEWERDGEPTVYAIMDAADIPERAAKDVQTILADQHFDFDAETMGEESEFSKDAHYEEIMPSDEDWHAEWQQFENTIKSEARFFSRTAAAQLSELFDTIDEMRTSRGRPLVIDAGPGTEIERVDRARVFQSHRMLESALVRPDLELGAPPSALASAGRMNARGISVFYGATKAEIAVAEVRPPVGSMVALAQFEIIRPIRLLDLAALREVHEEGSIFESTFARRLGRMVFLRSLSARIAKPVMPDDQESEYLPTQAIADFLATEGKVPLDGILFPSVQDSNDGLNVVLFHKAARCMEIEFPEGTEFSVHTDTTYEDESKPYYFVAEEVPPEKTEPEEDKLSDFLNLGALNRANWYDFDGRAETLRIDLNSVQVHIVNAASFDTSEHQVTRHRWTKGKPVF